MLSNQIGNQRCRSQQHASAKQNIQKIYCVKTLRFEVRSLVQYGNTHASLRISKTSMECREIGEGR
jgi:hypothetical protein